MPFCRPKCCACLAHASAADRSTVRSHTKDTHKSTEWKTGPTAHPLLAPQALTRRRWHGWLQEVRHLPLLGRLLLSCCVSCCAGPPQASGCCSSTDAPGRPESSAGESDKPALSFSWFSLCVAAASGVSFVRIITLHSSVNPLL